MEKISEKSLEFLSNFLFTPYLDEESIYNFVLSDFEHSWSFRKIKKAIEKGYISSLESNDGRKFYHLTLKGINLLKNYGSISIFEALRLKETFYKSNKRREDLDIIFQGKHYKLLLRFILLLKYRNPDLNINLKMGNDAATSFYIKEKSERYRLLGISEDKLYTIKPDVLIELEYQEGKTINIFLEAETQSVRGKKKTYKIEKYNNFYKSSKPYNNGNFLVLWLTEKKVSRTALKNYIQQKSKAESEAAPHFVLSLEDIKDGNPLDTMGSSPSENKKSLFDKIKSVLSPTDPDEIIGDVILIVRQRIAYEAGLASFEHQGMKFKEFVNYIMPRIVEIDQETKSVCLKSQRFFSYLWHLYNICYKPRS